MKRNRRKHTDIQCGGAYMSHITSSLLCKSTVGPAARARKIPTTALCQRHKALPYCPPLPLHTDISGLADRFCSLYHTTTIKHQKEVAWTESVWQHPQTEPRSPELFSTPDRSSRIFSTMDRSPAALPPAGGQESCSRPQLMEGPPRLDWSAPRPAPWLLEANTVSIFKEPSSSWWMGYGGGEFGRIWPNTLKHNQRTPQWHKTSWVVTVAHSSIRLSSITITGSGPYYLPTVHLINQMLLCTVFVILSRSSLEKNSSASTVHYCPQDQPIREHSFVSVSQINQWERQTAA